jgi:hypothetical protein
MSDYVIQIAGYAQDIPCPYVGQFLKSFTPREKVKGSFTPDIAKAMRFKDQVDAWEMWRTSIGTRPDGKPDRPLTAFSVSIVLISDSETQKDQ